ncbi:MAG: hypothetical protein CVV44_04595 [Spirochaetae bacterium HGW-Spirochaetae-1]|jgi:hypothetical protein|nr:MAG: hypothetical protein CVV44_04595 [Spirochaetae bacterium HGW-Spirochaetae-1]
MKERLRILIAADSMAMPRSVTSYEETWIHMLKTKFPLYDIIDKSERGFSTERLVTAGGGGVDLLEMYTPDIVILQAGMIDAAPRLFRRQGFEYWFLQNVIPLRFKKTYIDYIKRHRGRRPETTYISPEKFRSNIINYFDRAVKIDCRIIAILLAKPNRNLLAKSPYAYINIEKYNAIYREVASSYSNVMLIQPFDDDYDYDRIVVDEYHHNGEGAEIICAKLSNAIKQLTNRNPRLRSSKARGKTSIPSVLK